MTLFLAAKACFKVFPARNVSLHLPPQCFHPFDKRVKMTSDGFKILRDRHARQFVLFFIPSILMLLGEYRRARHTAFLLSYPIAEVSCGTTISLQPYKSEISI